MKSGLEGRNNALLGPALPRGARYVSMKSGLEGRNNSGFGVMPLVLGDLVSMKSGLEGRNNARGGFCQSRQEQCLNEVRPRRPEQSGREAEGEHRCQRLNEVRPRRPEQLGAMVRLPQGKKWRSQ